MQVYEGDGMGLTRADLEAEMESMRTYNDVMSTRLANFQEQLAAARDDMSDEINTAQVAQASSQSVGG